MTRVNWQIISFSGNAPHRLRFDGERLGPASEQGGRKAGATIVLLPDDYFFFDLVSAPRSMRERRIHSGLLLRMRHNFPAPVQNQERGAFRATPLDVLGYNTHPALADFINEHKDLLDSADVVTNSLVVALNAARSSDIESWTWNSQNGPAAFYHNGELQYFRSGGKELDKRVELAGAETAPKRLDLEESLTILAREGVQVSRLRLPLRLLKAEGELEPRFWARLTAAVLIAGLLFCTGQAFRLYSAGKEARANQQAVEQLYVRALGNDPGPDPFGRLLFLLDQRKGGGRKGADLLGLLGVLSENAPPGLEIESMTFSGETGSIRGLVDGFDNLEDMLGRLSAVEDYDFTLEQASNTENGVLMNLNFVKR